MFFSHRSSVTGCLLLFLCPLVALSRERGNARPPACDQYDSVQVPLSDLPTNQDRKVLASCTAEDLYFGFDHPANPERARKCAYIEREKEEGEGVSEKVFGAAGLLTMIYANGKGAARNFDLALKFACEVDGAEAENFGRFNHLLRLRNENWAGNDFNLCDDATSGFMEGWCAHLQERFDEAERRRKLENIVKNWHSADKAAFVELRRSANAFFEASARNEVDLTGTGRAAFEIEAEATLNDGFIEALEKFERGQLPNFTLAEFRVSDAKLNADYAKTQSQRVDHSMIGTVTPEGIKIAQRAWLRYREAWVRFGHQKYPGVSADSWRTWLTQERVKMLQSPD